MKYKTRFKLIIIGLFFSTHAFAAEVVSLKDFLKKDLSGSAKMSKEVFQVSSEQKKLMKAVAENADDNSFTFYYGKNAEGKLEKACTVVPQMGKEGPMTVGVCFEPTGLVSDVAILTYQEDHGRKVAEDSFLKQFKGKKISDAFQVGKDINGISGATISSKSVSEALRKSAFAFKTFIKGSK